MREKERERKRDTRDRCRARTSTKFGETWRGERAAYGNASSELGQRRSRKKELSGVGS